MATNTTGLRRVIGLARQPLVRIVVLLLAIIAAGASQLQIQWHPPALALAGAGRAAPESVLACAGDEHEPNDAGWATAGCVLALGEELKGEINPQHAKYDQDWYLFVGHAGQPYRIRAVPLASNDVALLVAIAGAGPAPSCCDTEPSPPTPPPGLEILGTADAGGQGATERLDVTVPADGYYAVRVTGGRTAGTYTVRVIEKDAAPPAATEPPGPAPTAAPGAQYEPWNNTYNGGNVPVLILGTTIRDHLDPSTGDPADWWQFPVVHNRIYTCRARGVAAPNSGMLVPRLHVEWSGIVLGDEYLDYDGDGWVSVSFSTQSIPDGAYVYPSVNAQNGGGQYELVCAMQAPGGGDPPGGSGTPGATPRPGGTPAPGGTTTQQWVPVSSAQSTPEAVTVLAVLVYYDSNASGQPEEGEGLKGISVRAVSAGRFVAWGLTNELGEATVVVQGPVDRVWIPFLNNASQAVRAGKDNPQFVFRIAAVPVIQFFPVQGR